MIDPPDAPLGFAALPEELRARGAAELASGERLLWAGRPDANRPSAVFVAQAYSLVWAVAWTGLGVFWLVLSLRHALRTDATPSPLWSLGIVFGAIASTVAFLLWVALLANRVKYGPERDRQGRELYALSDRRALIWRPVAGTFAVSVHQFARGSIQPSDIQRIEYPNGSGDLMLRAEHPEQGFRGIEEVRRVDELARWVLIGPPHPHSPLDDDYEEPF